MLAYDVSDEKPMLAEVGFDSHGICIANYNSYDISYVKIPKSTLGAHIGSRWRMPSAQKRFDCAYWDEPRIRDPRRYIDMTCLISELSELSSI